VLFDNPSKNIESLIAKSADLTNKPFVHSVVKINGEYEIEEKEERKPFEPKTGNVDINIEPELG